LDLRCKSLTLRTGRVHSRQLMKGVAWIELQERERLERILGLSDVRTLSGPRTLSKTG